MSAEQPWLIASEVGVSGATGVPVEDDPVEDEAVEAVAPVEVDAVDVDASVADDTSAGDRATFTLAPPMATVDVVDVAAVDAVAAVALDDDDAPRPAGLKQLTRRERRQLGRLRARKVSRVVRRIDPWSVLLISLGFYLCLFAVLMVAGLLLWGIASATGTIHQIEGTVRDLFAEKSFHFDGLKIFRASFLGGLILVIAGSGLNVLLCTLFNLISDLVGGIRVTVIEEETARPPR